MAIQRPSPATPNGKSTSPIVRAPTLAQRRYLERGLAQAGGKLPLFDRNGREIDPKTVRACIERGWAEPWFENPMKPDWIICKLTAAGYEVVRGGQGVEPDVG